MAEPAALVPAGLDLDVLQTAVSREKSEGPGSAHSQPHVPQCGYGDALLGSVVPAAGAGNGVTHHTHPTTTADAPLVLPQAWAARWSRGRRGGISWGGSPAPSLLQQHGMPDCTMGITGLSQGLPVATGKERDN